MSVLGIFKVLKDVVFPTLDKAIVDKDKVRELKFQLEMAILDMDKRELEAATQVIIAEAGGEGFLQRNWRPVTMLSFVAMLMAYYLGFAPEYLVDNPDVTKQLFEVIQFGLGGYVAFRSAEKGVEMWQEPKRLEAEAKVIEAESKSKERAVTKLKTD